MAWRNAFEAMMTERTGRLILAATNYARDLNDRMRVVVDNQISANVTAGPYLTGTTARTERLLYDQNATFMTDDRDELRLTSQAAARASRQKWTIT